MEQIATFGIGCFHFGMNMAIPYHFSATRYAQTVEEFLGSLDTVGTFSVTMSGLAAGREREITEEPRSMSDGWVFPLGAIQSMEFSLRIPHRTQEEIIQGIRGRAYRWPGLKTEHFMVRTEYFYHGPVTLVECLDLDDERPKKPSDAVVVVREYLARRLDESDHGLRLEYTGPSPFHANFFAFEDQSVDEFVRVEHIQKPGYDVIKLFLQEGALTDGCARLLDWMGPWLVAVYELERMRNRRIHKWAKIQSRMRSLDKLVGRKSYLKKLVGIYRRRANIEMLVKDVMSLRATTMFERQAASSLRTDLSENHERIEFLDKSVVKAFEGTFFEYPTSEVLELANFYEARDAKWRDRAYFLLAALVGGAVGALITRWLTAG